MRRSVAVTLATAAATIAAMIFAGVLLQSLALSQPSEGRRAALRAALWLQRFRLVDSVVRIGDARPVHARCLRTWFVRDGRRRRGSALRLDNGFALNAILPHTLESSGGTAAERAVNPLVLLELGGCPGVLARRLGTLAQRLSGATVTVGRRTALHFDLKATHLTLYLDPKTGRPTDLRVRAPGVQGSSRLSFTRLTPALAEQIRSEPAAS
jgi:hypothetical protein